MNSARPNILIFMTDHQRFDTVPPFNRALTPNLDRFYKEAVSFTNTYCPSPHCCPARTTLYSGLYPSEHGVWNNVNVGNCLSKGPYKGIRMWSQDLKDAGYKTYFTGKWHVSNQEGPDVYGFDVVRDKKIYEGRDDTYNLPTNYEWDVYYKDFEKMKGLVEKGINIKGRMPDGSRQKAQLFRSGYPGYTYYGSTENPFNDQKVIDDALELLEDCFKQEDPWCLYTGVVGPHDPYYVPQKFIDMYKDFEIELPVSFDDDMNDKPAMYRRIKQRFGQMESKEHLECLKHYLAFCTYEDYLFGKIYQQLIDADQLKNTIVMYLSDHGDYAGDHGLWAKGLPCFNGAYHIPLLVGGYNFGAKGRVCDEYVCLADIAPTILEMAEIDYAKDRFSGKSFLPLIVDPNSTWAQRAVYSQTNGNELYGIQRSVMTKEWKYIYNGFDFDELYDLVNDPNQMINLADKDETDAIQKELSILLWKFAYEHKDVCINPYIMVSLAKYGPGVAFGWE